MNELNEKINDEYPINDSEIPSSESSHPEENNPSGIGDYEHFPASVSAEMSIDEPSTLDRDQTKLVIHAILFISDKPVPAQRISEILGDIEVEVVKTLVEELKEEINKNTTLPYVLREIAGGYQLFTRPEFSPYIQKFLQVKKMRRFTPALLETLAIIAYKQPVTRVEVEAIRGVSVAHAFEQLQERNLIRVCGVSELPGKPKLYRTTEEFLAMFGLNSLQDLPSIDELKEEK